MQKTGRTGLKKPTMTVRPTSGIISCRIHVAQLPVMYTFMMPWGEMRGRGEAIGGDWPMPGSIEAMFEQFKEVAEEKKISMTEAMKRLRRQKPQLHATFVQRSQAEGHQMYAMAR